MLQVAESRRNDIHAAIPRDRKAMLGQFMTPDSIAGFMVSLFPDAPGPRRLLDAGAGLGALSRAVLDRWRDPTATVEAYEIDSRLRGRLSATLAGYPARSVIHARDFLGHAAQRIAAGEAPFTHAILNPPYKKIATTSEARAAASRAGLETVNLYSAFVGLALALLRPGGQLVAIMPRSFANGPYYKPFRKWIRAHGAIRHLHLFGSRDSAFRDDGVLQENIILRIERGGEEGPVQVSHSSDERFTDLSRETTPYSAIFRPGDRELFLHVPDGTADPLDTPRVASSLTDLGVAVSTGPVVDFRMRENLRQMPSHGDAPLIYPHHLSGASLAWPAEGSKKANAIADNERTARWLFPAGTYVLTRRFSAKEERRRVVAYLLPGEALPGSRVGFENHMNVFHASKRGLPEALAWGLYAWLNSTALDQHLRRFSGHTQINATDLRNMRYPDRATLEALGEKAKKLYDLDQDAIDRLVGELLG
ncbi:SAM-dependent methyltransferase [Lysobacter pythonis]|uniref:site-specific DNA-methyltransferase (adenine-specific) n=1 Tax=Solilutibacter pythonis TaxID=2483112 RepID=A0A3M2I308_9GAMM|nr:Eco57I restriction-modification methylase domain-containing protein [Lysobacter pythonis]RMH92887.1 SAM-dependent methyltransferase [Lysobacter pythonis]